MTVAPPFNIAETIPADNAIVSQFPAAERTYRDTVESWLLINHNTMGRHFQVDLDQTGTQPNLGIAGVATIWAHTDGSLRFGSQSGQTFAEVLSVPVGVTLPFAGNNSALPVGYIFCNGAAISRTSFARLFASIATSYGAGDGSTTFNVPDLRGRAIFGKDNIGGAAAAGRITPASGFVGSGQADGGTGGLETNTLDTSMIPSHSHPNTVGAAGHVHPIPAMTTSGRSATHTHTSGAVSGNTGGVNSVHQHAVPVLNVAGGFAGGGGLSAVTGYGGIGGTLTGNDGPDHSHSTGSLSVAGTGVDSVDHSHTIPASTYNTGIGTEGVSITNATAGGGLAHNNMPPGMTMNWIIKF